MLWRSGCKSRTACTNNEAQNFVGPVSQFHQCRSTNFLLGRFNRPIVCRFCHKMGGTVGDALLFSDGNGLGQFLIADKN